MKIPQFPWTEIDTIFLDMDGVLLDRYFDDFFWTEFVPQKWQAQNGGSLQDARQNLLATYKRVESTLDWYSLDYWSKQLQLDIPELQKEACAHITLRPRALDFLLSIQKQGKPLYLITNAHPKTITLKLEKFNLWPWFEQVISAEEIGFAKEQVQFWGTLQKHLPYTAETTFFADDTEKVLLSAQNRGPHHLLHIAKPSSQEEPRYSRNFPSVNHLADIA